MFVKSINGKKIGLSRKFPDENPWANAEEKYAVGNVVTGWTSMMVLMLFLFGLNFAFLGILGEYIGRIFLETKQRPNFIIEQVI